MDIQSFRYADINNNVFQGTPQKLSYLPIQPKESSSGIYSGGRTSEVKLEKHHWETIQTLLLTIIDNESLHLGQRKMLTTHLQIINNGQKQSWIIRRSEEQVNLETFLRQALGI